MSAIDTTYATPLTVEQQTHVDDLDLRDATIGGGLVLHKTDDRRLVIDEIDAGRIRRVGTFDSAASALRALDALDGPEWARFDAPPPPPPSPWRWLLSGMRL